MTTTEQNEILQLQQTLEGEKKRIQELERQLRALKTQSSSSQAMEKLHQDIEEKSLQLSRLQTNLEETKGEKEALQGKYDHLVTILSSLKAKWKEERDSSIQKLSEEKKQLEHALDLQYKQMATLEEKLKTHTQNPPHQKEKEENQQQIEWLSQDLDRVKNQNQQLQQEIRTLSENAHSLHQKYALVEQENQSLQKQCDAFLQKQSQHEEKLKQATLSLAKALTAAKQFQKEKEDFIASHQKENLTLSAKAEKLQELVNTYQMSLADLESLKKQKEELKVFKNRSEVLEDEKNLLLEKISSFSLQLNQKDESLIKVEEKVVKLSQEKVSLEASLHSSEKRLASLQALYETKKEELDSLLVEQKTWEKKSLHLNQLEKEASYLKISLEEQAKQLLKKDRLIQSLPSSGISLREELFKAQEEKESLKKELHQIKNSQGTSYESSSLKNQASVSHQDLQDLLGRYHQLEKDYHKTLQELSDTQTSLNALASQELLKPKLEALTSSFNELKTEYDTIKKERDLIQEELNKKSHDLDHLKGALLKLTEESHTLKASSQNLENEKEVLEAKLQQLQNNFSDLQNSYKGQQQTLEKTSSLYHNALEEIEKTQATCKSLQEKLSCLESDQKSWEEEKKQWLLFKESYADLEARITSDHTSYHESQKELSHQLQKQTEANQTLQKENEFLKKQIDEQKSWYAQLDQTIEKLQTEKQAIRLELDDLEKDYEDSINENEIYQKRIEDLEIALKDKQEVTEKEKISQQKLHEKLHKLELQLETQREEFTIAQQHLAKKVKQNAELSHSIEEHISHNHSLKNQLQEWKGRLIDLENALSLQKRHEEKLESLSKERILAVETEAKRWQGEFFKVQSQWQNALNRLKEMEKIEREYERLHGFFSNIRNIIGTTFNIPNFASPFSSHSQKDVIDLDLEHHEEEKEAPEIKSQKKPRETFKETLFD